LVTRYLGVHLSPCILGAHTVGQSAGDHKDDQFENAEAQAGPADDVHVVVPKLLELSTAAGFRLVDRRGGTSGLAIQVAAASSGNRDTNIIVVCIAGIAATVEGFLQHAHCTEAL